MAASSRVVSLDSAAGIGRVDAPDRQVAPRHDIRDVGHRRLCSLVSHQYRVISTLFYERLTRREDLCLAVFVVAGECPRLDGQDHEAGMCVPAGSGARLERRALNQYVGGSL